MRAVVFTMNSADVEPEAEALLRTMRAAGCSCVRVCYWTTDFVPLGALVDGAVPLLTLVQGGLANAPRLTAEAYVRCGGGIEDFADLALHDHAVHGWPLSGPMSEERLNLESAYYQRLRGCAAMARNLLRALEPDLVVVQQGAEPVSRAIAVEAGALGIPCLVWDAAFFPGFVSLDVGAQHFFRGASRIDRVWPGHAGRALAACDRQAVERFVAQWTASRCSKLPQASASAELARVEAFAADARGRLAFLPAQLPWDANVVPGLGAYGSLRELYEDALAHLPSGWKAVVKVHPKDASGAWSALAARPDLLVVEEMSIHDLVGCADIVLVHSSNVGLEALLLGKPVVVLGTPHYAGRGLTTDVERMADLGRAMAAARPPEPDLLARFLHFMVADHLIPVGDGARFAMRAAEAEAARAATPLARLADAYPARARRYLEAVAGYSRLAGCNWSDAEIRGALRERLGASADAAADRAPQRPSDYGDVEPAGLARYLLAARLVAPGWRVLDLGCGAGYGAHLLAGRGAQVDAVDASSEVIAFARTYWACDRIAFRVVSAGRLLERLDALYDAVVCFGTVELVPNARLLLRQLWARVRPGGLMIVSTPDAERCPLGNNVPHVRHFDRQSLSDEIDVLECVAGYRIWPQDGALIAPSVRAGRFLVAALVKCGPTAPLVLDAAVPFHMAAAPARDTFRIGAEAFSTTTAHRELGRIVSSFEPTDCNIVYGPYRTLAAGRYRIAFGLETEPRCAPGPGAITLEVVTTRADVLARRKLTGRELVDAAPEAVCLGFDNAEPKLRLEFRIHVSGWPVTGTLAFSGVTITRRGETAEGSATPSRPVG
jgi:2-polyprenyl-3-methyl-5-hydroxy-6-metoxy-1,4-benzoquinol methylase